MQQADPSLFWPFISFSALCSEVQVALGLKVSVPSRIILFLFFDHSSTSELRV